MTIQEIEEFVQGELSDLNLSTEEKNKYIKFIKKQDTHYKTQNMNNIDAKNVFMQKFEDTLEFFRLQGFDEATALTLTKHAIIEYDRKKFQKKLAFLRVINFEEKVIMKNSLSLRFNLEKVHAKKMYLVSINNKKDHTSSFLIHDSDDRVKKRFNVDMDELTKQYPLSEETTEVWMIIATMNNQKFEEYFRLTREQLSYIYPTTKEELATLHKIATMKDEEIIENYGLTRDQLLEKHPLNTDTLNALRSIKKSSDKAIENTFNKTRQELVNLRTITTDMIRIAQKERLMLRGKVLTKEELREQFKTMKKGTHPNG